MVFNVVLALLTVPVVAPSDEEAPRDVFYQKLEAARAEYRTAVAKRIRYAPRVDLFLLRFDGMDDHVNRSAGYGTQSTEQALARFEVAPYGSSTVILDRKKLSPAQAKELLNLLARQIEKSKHNGGALCHFPVHGIRVYSDANSESILYSGTFCWKCSNFGFAYPEGTAWLDTSEALKKSMNRLLPIPAKEIERFEKKYPSKTPP